MTWRWEYGEGYFECNPASSALRYAAIRQAEIVQFAAAVDPKKEVVKRFDKTTRRIRKIPIKVAEVGRGLNLPANFTPFIVFDSANPIQKRLIRQLRTVLDRCCAHALRLGSVDITRSRVLIKRLIPRAKWSEMEATLAIVSGYMDSVTEPYDGMSYIGIGGSRLIRRIKQFAKIFNWSKYLKEGDVLYQGEVGQTNNNIRWIKCTDPSCFSGDGVVFGDQGLIFREVQTPKLRLLMPMIAWFGVLAFGGQNVLHIPERKE